MGAVQGAVQGACSPCCGAADKPNEMTVGPQNPQHAPGVSMNFPGLDDEDAGTSVTRIATVPPPMSEFEEYAASGPSKNAPHEVPKRKPGAKGKAAASKAPEVAPKQQAKAKAPPKSVGGVTSEQLRHKLTTNKGREWFDHFDVDRSDELEKDELVTALLLTFKGSHTMKLEDVTSIVDNLWGVIDADGSGAVDFEEFQMLREALLAEFQR